MAYLRKRGNQLAIVHGERDPDTRQVQQRVLFTLYSKAEAREAIGEGSQHGAHEFRSRIEAQYPSIRFDWEKIEGEIASNVDVLPESYSYREERLTGRFRGDLRAFARQIMLADPVQLSSAAEVIRENHFELEFLSELIDARLQNRDAELNEWAADNAFFWRFQLQGDEAPADAEDRAEDFFEKGDLDRAEAVFKLLIECFGEYAEGHNYLGLIAWDRGDLEEALGHFREAMVLGRKRFPRRLPREDYWNDLDTRPYVRALRNYALMLARLGRMEESLIACARLEDECGDDLTAAAYRAPLYLTAGLWKDAAQAARTVSGLWPSNSFIAAFAQLEMGQKEDALASFLHGALNLPRTARMVVGKRTRKPAGNTEIQDHNDGVALLEAIDPHLACAKGKRARKTLSRVLDTPQVAAMLGEIGDVQRRRVRQHNQGRREAFDRMTEMVSQEYATERASELGPLLMEEPTKRRSR